MNRKLIIIVFSVPACLVPPTVRFEPADEGEVLESESASEPEPEPEPEPDSAGFVPEPDVPLRTNQCEDLGSSECGPGLKCTLAREGNDFIQVCAPLVDDPLPSGSACELGDEPGEDDCASDAVCWDVNGVGTCLRFCNDIDDYEAAQAQCGEGFTCNYFKSLPGDDAICTPTCTPFEGNCPGSCGCFWIGSEFMCTPLTENIPTGQPCDYINDCMMDHYCAPAEFVPDCQGSSCCAAFCLLSGASCAQPGTECVPFFEIAPPGLEDIGVCILPDT